jgi:hypothetical protein
MQTQNNGNNETSIRGISELHGKFTAHTGVTSKTFKTRAGAEKYLAKFGVGANGERL